MMPLLKLSLRQMTGRRRLALLVFLAALPIALAALLATLVGPGSAGVTSDRFASNFVNTIMDGMLIAVIMPIIVMALATAAFGNEMEDRTLNVLVLKPISRMAIVMPKLLGSILVAAPLLLVSGTVAVGIALEGAGGQGILAAAVALLAGVVTYAAVFTWAGLVSNRALGFALVYVFLWEGLVTSFLSGVRYLSVRGYTLGILNGLDPDTFSAVSERTIEFPAAIAGAVIVTVVFFLLTVRRLQRMDVP